MYKCSEGRKKIQKRERINSYIYFYIYIDIGYHTREPCIYRSYTVEHDLLMQELKKKTNGDYDLSINVFCIVLSRA